MLAPAPALPAPAAPRQKRGEGSKPWYSARRNAFRVRLPRVPGQPHQADRWVKCDRRGILDTTAESEAWRLLRREVTGRETGGVTRNLDRRSKVGPWVIRYVDELATDLRESSRRNARYKARVIAADPIGRLRLVDLAPTDVSAFLRRLESTGSSANRRYAILSLLRVAIKAAVDDQRVPRNVATLVKPPKRTTKMIRSPREHEVKAIVAATNPHPVYGAAIALCAYTGCRIGEALALRWTDLRPDPAYPNQPAALIESTMSMDGARGAPKSEAGRRYVPLAPAVVALLRERQRYQLASGSSNPSGLIFTVAPGPGRHRAIGAPIRVEAVYQHYMATQRALGIGPYRLHDLRHEAASRMLRKGVDVRRVQQILGHASLATTARYLHSEGDVAAALDLDIAVGR